MKKNYIKPECRALEQVDCIQPLCGSRQSHFTGSKEHSGYDLWEDDAHEEADDAWSLIEDDEPYE